MSALSVTQEQIRAIHAIRTRTRLPDSSYRGLLAAYDVASSKDLTRADADRLLVRMRDIPGASTPVQRPRAAGRYAGKLQAMWIALHNLGAVLDCRDSAMHAFLERQTGVPHTRFLQQASEAQKAIEALKAWLIREGVAWPAPTGDAGLDRFAMKRAILRAQWMRLTLHGAVRPFGDPTDSDGLVEYVSGKVRGNTRRLGSLDDPSLTAEDLDKAARFLGAWIRRIYQTAEHRHVG